MKITIPQLPLVLYAILGSISLGLAIVWHQFATNTFFDRTIGAFILGEVNIASRNVYYMLGIVIAFCAISCIVWLIQPKLLSTLRYRTLSSSGFAPNYLLATIAAVNAILYLVYKDSLYSNVVWLLLIVTAMQLAIGRVLRNDMSLAAGVWIQVLAYQVSLGVLLFFTEKSQLGLQFLVLFLTLGFTLTLLYKKQRSSVYWMYPLAWLPLISILASEFNYFLLQRLDLQISYTQTFSIFVGALLLICAFLSWSKIRRNSNDTSTPQFIFRRYLPAIVLCNVALVEYSAFQTYSFYDYFHLGEAIVPLQQWSQHGAIPYIDYYPPHGLFDLFPQLLYSIAFGYQGLEVTTWGQGYMLGWLPRMLAAYIFFVFFSKFWGRLPTALILLFLPTYHLIHPYYAFVLIPALALYRLSLSPDKTTAWLTVWFTVLVLGLWRIDFGIAATAGCLVISMLIIWQQQSFKAFFSCIFGLALVALTGFILFALIASLKDQSSIVILKNIIQYAKIQLPVASYIEVVNEYNAIALLQLAILPMLSIVAIVVVVNRAIFLRLPVSRLERTLIFVAVVSLVMSFRSLQRHSLAEDVFNPYFFAFIGLSLLCYLPRKRLTFAHCILAMGIGFSAVLLPKSTDAFSYVYYNSSSEKEYLLLGKDYSFPRWDNKPLTNNQRVDDRVTPHKVIGFLDRNLERNQSFYDFTDSPLIYALVGRELPNYVFETVYHTSEFMQHEVIADLEKLRVQNRLPLVLMNNHLVDGVSNFVRSYRVAEYLYQNYQPCTQVDTYYIWTEHNPKGVTECSEYQKNAEKVAPAGDAETVAKDFIQAFDIGFLPRIWAQADPYCALCQASILSFNTELTEQRSWQLDLPSTITDDKQASYLVLEMAASQDTILQFRYGNGVLSMNIKASDSPLRYILRPSMLHSWWTDSSAVVELSTTNPAILVSAELLEAD